MNNCLVVYIVVILTWLQLISPFSKKKYNKSVWVLSCCCCWLLSKYERKKCRSYFWRFVIHFDYWNPPPMPYWPGMPIPGCMPGCIPGCIPGCMPGWPKGFFKFTLEHVLSYFKKNSYRLGWGGKTAGSADHELRLTHHDRLFGLFFLLLILGASIRLGRFQLFNSQCHFAEGLSVFN